MVKNNKWIGILLIILLFMWMYLGCRIWEEEKKIDKKIDDISIKIDIISSYVQILKEEGITVTVE